MRTSFRMYWISILISLISLKLVSCQTTENPHHTVTYNPGKDCLPYDGSVVPDCPSICDTDILLKCFKYIEHSSSKLEYCLSF